MIWSKKLALCLTLIRGATAASASAKPFAPGDGADHLDGGTPLIATLCLTQPAQSTH